VESFLQVSPPTPCMIFLLPHMCHKAHPFKSPTCSHPNNIW
jgi:hypothetical protein